MASISPSGEKPVSDVEDVPGGEGDHPLLPSERVSAPEMFYTCTTRGPQEWLHGEHICISAGNAWRAEYDRFDHFVPDAEELFIDCGGFQAVAKFGGEYPYTPTELFEWAESVGADYVAGMDWMCAPASEIAAQSDELDVDDIASIPERVQQTITRQIEQYEVYRRGDYSFTFVPTLQGYSPADYRYCAARLKEARVEADYVGIGSTGKRDDPQKTLRIVRACEEAFPAAEFHLFGMTLSHFQDRRLWSTQIRSGDTHAWARSNPETESGFCYSKAEKRKSFRYYKRRIQTATAKIDDQTPMQVPSEEYDRFSFGVAAAREGATECICGRSLPVREPADEIDDCSRCRDRELNRWDAALATVESLSGPDRVEDGNGADQAALSQF